MNGKLRSAWFVRLIVAEKQTIASQIMKRWKGGLWEQGHSPTEGI